MFLLKNRGLRLQLLVGLLLVLAALPERSEGLQCYNCIHYPAARKCTEKMTCTGPKPFCTKVMDKYRGGETLLVSRYCSGGSKELYSKCIAELGYANPGDHLCATIPGEDYKGGNNSTFAKKLYSCGSNGREEGSRFMEVEPAERQQTNWADLVFTQCVCDTDLCDPQPRSPKSSSSSIVPPDHRRIVPVQLLGLLIIGLHPSIPKPI